GRVIWGDGGGDKFSGKRDVAPSPLRPSRWPQANSLQWSEFKREGHERYARMAGWGGGWAAECLISNAIARRHPLLASLGLSAKLRYLPRQGGGGGSVLG